MTKFNLQDLPLCGAKTRSGHPCKRYGNKTNGRCKLHGGHSTGAKTKEGKLAVAVNPIVNSFTWFFKKHFDERISDATLRIAITNYMALIDLASIQGKEFSDQVITIVSESRIELECLKYLIASHDGPEALMLIQSALDHYYTHTDAKHLHFHIYTPIAPSPYFYKFGSKAQIEAQIVWDAKKMKPGGFL
jgi:hypothetical protein